MDSMKVLGSPFLDNPKKRKKKKAKKPKREKLDKQKSKPKDQQSLKDYADICDSNLFAQWPEIKKKKRKKKPDVSLNEEFPLTQNKHLKLSKRHKQNRKGNCAVDTHTVEHGVRSGPGEQEAAQPILSSIQKEKKHKKRVVFNLSPVLLEPKPLQNPFVVRDILQTQCYNADAKKPSFNSIFPAEGHNSKPAMEENGTESQSTSDDINSQDLFITQKSFLDPYIDLCSSTSAEEALEPQGYTETCPEHQSYTASPPKKRSCPELQSYTASPPKKRSCPEHQSYTASSPRKQSCPEPQSYTASPPRKQSCPEHYSYTASPPKKRSCPEHQSYTASSPRKQSCPEPQSYTASPPRKQSCPEHYSYTASPPRKQSCPELQSYTASPPRKLSCPERQSYTVSPPRKQSCPEPQSYTVSPPRKRSCPELQSYTVSPPRKRSCPEPQSYTVSPPRKRSCPELQSYTASPPRKQSCPERQSYTVSPTRKRSCPELQSYTVSPPRKRSCPEPQSYTVSSAKKHSYLEHQSDTVSSPRKQSCPEPQSLPKKTSCPAYHPSPPRKPSHCHKLDASTQTENFFTSPLLATSLRSRHWSTCTEVPMDLSLPKRSRLLQWEGVSKASADQRHPEPSATDLTQSDDSDSHLKSKADLSQLKVVQTRLNESFFFKLKGDGDSPKPRSPLMKFAGSVEKRKP